METECSGHTEPAAHLTARLGGYTECSAVILGDIDCFHKLSAGIKEVFTRTIGADGFADGRMATDGISCLERLTALERDIRHLIYRPHTAHVEPVRQLFAGELLQANAQCDLLQLT